MGLLTPPPRFHLVDSSFLNPFGRYSVILMFLSVFSFFHNPNFLLGVSRNRKNTNFPLWFKRDKKYGADRRVVKGNCPVCSFSNKERSPRAVLSGTTQRGVPPFPRFTIFFLTLGFVLGRAPWGVACSGVKQRFGPTPYFPTQNQDCLFFSARSWCRSASFEQWLLAISLGAFWLSKRSLLIPPCFLIPDHKGPLSRICSPALPGAFVLHLFLGSQTTHSSAFLQGLRVLFAQGRTGIFWIIFPFVVSHFPGEHWTVEVVAFLAFSIVAGIAQFLLGRVPTWF